MSAQFSSAEPLPSLAASDLTFPPGQNRKPVTIRSIQQRKAAGKKCTVLTCYDYTTAKILDSTDIDILLVGDSLAMTVLGHPNTLSVTMDEMLHHVKAVSRGVSHALIVADMPFLSYQVSHADAIRNAGRFIQEGHAAAVKLEGASEPVLAVVTHLVNIGIPVMGHVGFTPQSVHTLGGYRVQGTAVDSAIKLLEDAKALQAAGVFALVLEMVPHEVAAYISKKLAIPTIGIGAGNGCDGQVLVIDDLLGRYPDLSPKFARRYMQGATATAEAAMQYAADVHAGQFPNNNSEAFAFPAEQWLELVTHWAAGEF